VSFLDSLCRSQTFGRVLLSCLEAGVPTRNAVPFQYYATICFPPDRGLVLNVAVFQFFFPRIAFEDLQDSLCTGWSLEIIRNLNLFHI
jgi:hypothetical protein